jgi:copper resistance protein B
MMRAALSRSPTPIVWGLAAGCLMMGTASSAQAQDAAAMPHHHHGPVEAPLAEPISTSTPAAESPVASAPPPPPPLDHAADSYYDPAEMAQARNALAYESGGMPNSMLRIDRFERRVAKGADGYHWEGEGYTGGDIDRLFFKTEGEGDWNGALERAELQLLYSHAIGPYFNLQAGLRHDVRPSPQRSYAVIAVKGLAPYWLQVEGEAFFSNKGEGFIRLEASYDQRITQRWILQPQVQLNFAAQTVPDIGIGAGLSSVEAGLRLRYEIVREFAPYVGLSWERNFGETRRLARNAGENRPAAALVVGIRTWF